MGKDLERVGAARSINVIAGGFCGAHSECGRRRHGNNQRDAEHRRLLHHFDGDPATEENDPLGRAVPGRRHRAQQLVERVMPAHVLPQRHEAGPRGPEGSRMHRPGQRVEPLCLRHRRLRRVDLPPQ